MSRVNGTAFAVALSVWICAGGAAVAGTTRVWELAGFDELEKGDADGTSVSSRGEVGLGNRATRIQVEGVGLVWSVAEDGKGRRYFGTGYDGRIFRVDGDKAVEVAETGQLVVTSLVFDRKGDLYAAALPDPVVWKVENPGGVGADKPVKAEKWCELPKEARYVWALAFDDKGDNLFAGTGPEGKLFAIGKDAKPKLYLDTKEEHVLSLFSDGKGALLAGTSPGAFLLKVTGPGRSTGLYDFETTEVKAIVGGEDDVYVAVNEFKVPPPVPTKPTDNNAQNAAANNAKLTKGQRSVAGRLYRVGANGEVEQIFEEKGNHVVSLALDSNGTLFAGLGFDGKVVSVDRNRVSRAELELEERQVMALSVGDGLVYATTGDAGAIYSVARARPGDAVYISPPLDAKATSRWGRCKWFSTGKLEVQSRSGNTATPDATWSDWSGPMAKGGSVKSAQASFLQLRFSWAKDPDAVLVSAQVAYRPLNQRAVITELEPESPFPKPKKRSGKEDDKDGTSDRTVTVDKVDKNQTQVELKWSTNNPDGDKLRYRLWYRAVGQKLWRPITKEDDVLTAASYKWNTQSVPEGFYQIRLAADDSPDNDPKETLSDEMISVPVLVDNHQPVVTKLKLVKGRLSGVAKDSFSEISKIELSIDAGPWLSVFSKDGLFDETAEEFESALPEGIAKGPHAVAVRAFDRAGNFGVAEIHIDL